MSSQSKKIVMFCRAWYPNHQALFEKLQLDLGPNFEVIYLLLGGVEDTKYNKRSVVFDQKCGLKRILLKSYIISLKDKDIYFPRGAWSVLKDLRPDILLFTPWSDLNALISICYAKLYGCKLVLWAPGVSEERNGISSFVRYLLTRVSLWWCVLLSDSIFCYGQSVIKSISELFFIRKFKHIAAFINVKHNIDEKIFSINTNFEKKEIKREATLNYGLEVKALIIGYVGQLQERKGIRNFLSLAESVQESGLPNLPQFVILGDGPLGHLIKKSASVALWKKALPQSELRGFFGMCDIVVVPSIRDDWCTVVNEAMWSRCVVVASSGAYATRDLIENGVTGFSYPPHDQAQLREIVLRLINEHLLIRLISTRGYDFIRARWTFRQTLFQWIQGINKLIA